MNRLKGHYVTPPTYEDSGKFARIVASLIYKVVKTRADKRYSNFRYNLSQCCFAIMHGNYSAKTQIKRYWKHYRGIK